jgi:hypothetical protein
LSSGPQKRISLILREPHTDLLLTRVIDIIACAKADDIAAVPVREAPSGAGRAGLEPWSRSLSGDRTVEGLGPAR